MIDLLACKIGLRTLCKDLTHCFAAVDRTVSETARILPNEEQRLTREDHPYILDEARQRLLKENKELETKLYALRALKDTYFPAPASKPDFGPYNPFDPRDTTESSDEGLAERSEFTLDKEAIYVLQKQRIMEGKLGVAGGG